MPSKRPLKKFRGPLLIVVIVVLANVLYISGIFKADPRQIYSGINVNSAVGILSGSQPTIDPNNAYTTQALGHAAARDLLHGTLPWWNHDEQVGAPLAGEMQSAALFLPFVLLLSFGGGLLAFHMVLQIIAGVSTYYLLKKLGRSEWAATLGGCLFAINGTFAWLTNAAFNPIAFLPLALLGIEYSLDNKPLNRNLWWILVACAIALSLYAGFPETAFIDGLFAGAWFLVRVSSIKKSDRRNAFIKISWGFVCGALLAAPILVAFADYYPYANVGGHTGLFKLYALPPVGIASLFMPYVFGPIFAFSSYDKTGALQQIWGSTGGYTSLSLFVLACFGFWLLRKNGRLIYFLAAWIVIAIARIYGLLYMPKLLSFIPGLSVTAPYRYLTPSLILALIILGVSGADKLASMRTPIKQDRRLLLVCAFSFIVATVIVIVGITGSASLTPAPHHRLWLAFSLAASIFSLGIIVYAVYVKKYLRVVVAVVLIGEALCMFMIPHLSSPRSGQIDIKPIQFLRQNLGEQRVYTMGPLRPNYSSYYDIASINTNNLPTSKEWSKYITEHLNPNASPIDGFTGVDRIKPEGISPLTAFDKYFDNYQYVGVKYILVNKRFLPQQIIDNHHLKLVFEDSTFQIFELPAPSPYLDTSAGHCVKNILNRDEVFSNCRSETEIIRKELYMPGWGAKLEDGTKLTINKSGLFQATSIPAGPHTITYKYAPPHLLLGSISMLFALTSIIVVLGTRLHYGVLLKYPGKYFLYVRR